MSYNAKPMWEQIPTSQPIKKDPPVLAFGALGAAIPALLLIIVFISTKGHVGGEDAIFLVLITMLPGLLIASFAYGIYKSIVNKNWAVLLMSIFVLPAISTVYGGYWWVKDFNMIMERNAN